MKPYQVFYLYRHVPPQGSVHIRESKIGVVNARSRKDAIEAAKRDHPTIASHLAVQRLDSKGDLVYEKDTRSW
jgi:hypothetical protein